MIVDEIVGRRFAAVDNDHGISGADTVFQYRRDGRLQIDFDWAWLDGGMPVEQSRHEEI